MASQVKSYQTPTDELTAILVKLFQKIAEEKILPYLFLEAAITLIPRSDKTITQEKKKKKKNYRPIALTNRGKSPQKKKKKKTSKLNPTIH